MSGNIFTDLWAALRLTSTIRQARKVGDSVELRRVHLQLTVRGSRPSFDDTVEGCVLANCTKDIRDISRQAFRDLPDAQACRFAFSPKNGEMVERAQIWRSMLTSRMTPIQLHTAMIALLRRYQHIKQKRAECVKKTVAHAQWKSELRRIKERFPDDIYHVLLSAQFIELPATDGRPAALLEVKPE